MFPGPTELRLIGYSIESIWTHKSKSSTSTPKTNLPTCSPREISHVTNGIIFCVCSEAMAKRSQQDSGEERVIAKSRPMMGLVARVPSTLSESPGKKSYESQSPWSANAEKNDRPGQPVVDRDVYSARYSRWDDDKAWSSQEWKADKSMDDRTGQPVVTSW